MKLDNIFSFRDFVNYYFPGVVWTLNILFVIFLFTGNIGISKSLGVITSFFEQLNILVAGILGIVIPYIIGFVLLPLGEWGMKAWQGKDRKRFPDPRIGLFYPHWHDKFQRKRFSKKESNRILGLAGKKFILYYKEDIQLYLFPVRAYVMEHGGNSAAFATRTRDLLNFTESISIPIPVNLFLVCLHLILFNWSTKGPFWLIIFASIIALVVSFLLHYFLERRYFKIEIRWVTHIYRAFQAIVIEK